MKVTRTVIVLAILFYVFLWVLALNGANRVPEERSVPQTEYNRRRHIAPRRFTRSQRVRGSHGDQ